MKKILFVNACVRGEESRTLELSRFYIEELLKTMNTANENCMVEEINLDKEYLAGRLVPQTSDILTARDDLMKIGDWDDPMFEYARQFNDADYIVIGAPFWDLNFPAVLRMYIERVSVPDLTYIYDEQGIPRGRSRIRGGAFVMTAGGPTMDMNYGYEYINGLFRNLFGLPELKLIKAEMLDMCGVDSEAVLEEAKAVIREEFGMK